MKNSFKALVLILTVLSFGPQAFAFGKCTDRYVPETTLDQLYEIREWARVIPFINHAEKAGFNFDDERYMQDYPNPNPGAFHFGMVTGLECYPVDVINQMYSYDYVLGRMSATNPEGFKSYFIQESERYGYMDYMSPIQDDITLSMN